MWRAARSLGMRRNRGSARLPNAGNCCGPAGQTPSAPEPQMAGTSCGCALRGPGSLVKTGAALRRLAVDRPSVRRTATNRVLFASTGDTHFSQTLAHTHVLHSKAGCGQFPRPAGVAAPHVRHSTGAPLRLHLREETLAPLTSSEHGRAGQHRRQQLGAPVPRCRPRRPPADRRSLALCSSIALSMPNPDAFSKREAADEAVYMRQASPGRGAVRGKGVLWGAGRQAAEERQRRCACCLFFAPLLAGGPPAPAQAAGEDGG